MVFIVRCLAASTVCASNLLLRIDFWCVAMPSATCCDGVDGRSAAPIHGCSSAAVAVIRSDWFAWCAEKER
eukprot:6211198-Pleurochrysis_carterae.AAC.9